MQDLRNYGIVTWVNNMELRTGPSFGTQGTKGGGVGELGEYWVDATIWSTAERRELWAGCCLELLP